jgi:flagellar secretion chaperone FliS
MSLRAANAYRRVDLESAPKHQVLERLFERFLRDVATARQAIEVKDVQTKANAIDHAIRIVVELAAALDHTAAPELCANLAGLYDFVRERLGAANASLAVAPLDQASKIMADLASAFHEVHPR